MTLSRVDQADLLLMDNKGKRGVKLLIDGDVLCYRAGFATDKTKYLAETPENAGADAHYSHFDDAKAAKLHGSIVWSRKETEPEDKALKLVDIMLNDIRSRYASENPTVSVYISGVGNYRFSVATRASYKGNRSGSPQPTHLRAIRNHLVTKHGAIVSAGEEADDLLGIAMTSFPDSVCVSIDKDLLQLPGRHYNFVTKEEVTVSKREAVLNFYSQVISGDSTDNIPGLTGFGPVKARKAIADCKSPTECWQDCVNMYINEFGGDGPKYALECAQLVYVRRTVGEIWSPPSAIKAAAKAAA